MNYSTGFYHEQGPVHIAYICALYGFPAPDPAGSYDYCELGCGTGLTSNVLAAANPQSRFVAIDLSPSHIEIAKDLAEASELTNIRFLADDIQAVDLSDFPQFDFITMHGLYSWIDDATQAAVDRFIAAKLNTGGALYVSYNTLPGFSSISPFRQFFVDMAARLDGDPLTKAEKILATLEDLKSKGAPFFNDHPIARQVLERMPKHGLNYIAHEFLPPGCRAFYFKEVNDRMAAAGLTFVGSSYAIDAIDDYSIAPAFLPQLNEIDDRVARESTKDFINNRTFRRDVYAKAESLPSAEQRSALLDKTLFSLSVGPAQVPKKVEIVTGDLEITGTTFDRLKHCLATEVHSLEELRKDAELSKLPVEELRAALSVMTLDDFVAPSARRHCDFGEQSFSRIQG